MSLPLLAIIQLMDGTNSKAEIQEHFARQFGETLPMPDLDRIIHQLDEIHLLDSERFALHQKAIEAEFDETPVRQPVCAGGAYPGEPEALAAYLDGIFESADSGADEDGEPAPGPMVGLIAPHIDTDRGGSVYASGYRELAARCDADTFVLFGTIHRHAEEMFVATTKGFETPLGVAEVDHELLAEIERRFGDSLRVGEILHRDEHSLEFQVLFLQHVLRGRPFSHRADPLQLAVSGDPPRGHAR